MESFQTQIEQKTNSELADLYINSQDYQPEFIRIVEEELKIKNIPIESIKHIKAESELISDKKLEIGEQGTSLYIAICFIAAILGGLISVISGYICAYSKRKNSKGLKVYVYNEQTRKY